MSSAFLGPGNLATLAHIFVCLKRQRFSNTSHTCDHAAKHNVKSAKQDIQTKHDAQPAEHLQELYDQDNNLNWNQEPHKLGFTHRISVVKSVSKNVDQHGYTGRIDDDNAGCVLTSL